MGLVWVVGAVVVLIVMSGAVLWSNVASSPPRLARDIEAIAHEVAEDLGVTFSRKTGTLLVFEGELSGHPAMFRVRYESRLGVEYVTRCYLDVAVPLPAVSLEFAGEETPNHRGGDVTPDERSLGLSPSPIVEGSATVAQMILSPSMRAFLMREPFGVLDEDAWVRWSCVRFYRGLKLSWRVDAFGRGRSFALEEVGRHWEALAAWAAEVVARCPRTTEVSELLCERALDPEEEEARRVGAASLLVLRYAGSRATTRLHEEAKVRGGWLGMLCGLMEDGRAFDATRAVLEFDGEVGEDLARKVASRWPWETCVDPHCPSALRDEILDEAWAKGPDERDEDIVKLLVSEGGRVKNRPGVYRAFRRLGWVPGPEARAALARRAVGSIRFELVRELRDLEVTREDVPMLLALKERGHEGDVAPYLEALGGDAVGQLTLSEGEAAGGLTALGERGALTPSGEE